MKMPWEDKTGLLKAFTIFASAFTIALGLCGVNVAIFNASRKGGTSLAGLLMVTGTAELATMIISAAALLILAIVWIVRALVERFSPPNKDQY